MNTKSLPRAAGEAAHTPTPYRVEIDGEFSGLCVVSDFGRVLQVCKTADIDNEARATADFVCRACNSHAALVEENAALKGENSELEKVAEAAGVEIDSLTQRNAALVAALEASLVALSRAIQHVPANAVNMDVAIHSPIEDARTLGHCERVLVESYAALVAAKRVQS